MNPEILRIGSRGSALALAQTHWVRERLRASLPELRALVEVIKTDLDEKPEQSIRASAFTGVWVKELEEALLSRRIDVAVHSMKDLPSQTPDNLEISAIPEREDARDALIARRGERRLLDLPAGAAVGTGSIRRQAQILAVRPDLDVRDIRGNVDTRLRKLDQGSYDALVLACAGLNRLGLQDRISAPLDLQAMLPAPGQGALALETRAADSLTHALLAAVHHAPTAVAGLAERAFLRRMGGGCNSPIAVHARPDGSEMVIEGLVAMPDGSRMIREVLRTSLRGANQAAEELADTLLGRGGREILRSLGRLP
jgi:hydroxymethylbilane synthase